MNKKMIGAVAVIIAVALKQYLGLELTESAIENTIEVLVQVVSAIVAGQSQPKGGV